MPPTGRFDDLLHDLAAVVRHGRRVRRWPQRRLASEVDVSQSLIARLERAQLKDVGIVVAARAIDALGGRREARFIGPVGPRRPQSDRAHARCVAYVARRLDVAGFLVATEAEIAAGRWRGFVDVIAFHQRERVLLVLEVKTEVHDVGDIDRQLGIAERGAWDEASRRGWRPRGVTGILVVLGTAEGDRRLADNRAYFDRRYRLRARALQPLVDGLPSNLARGERGLAMIDPATRRRAWLLPTSIDGRRTAARYTDRAAFLSGNPARPGAG